MLSKVDSLNKFSSIFIFPIRGIVVTQVNLNKEIFKFIRVPVMLLYGNKNAFMCVFMFDSFGRKKFNMFFYMKNMYKNKYRRASIE